MGGERGNDPKPQLIPIIEKYDDDSNQMVEQTTDQEKATVGEPSEDVQEAQAAIDRYESDVCAADQPAAADIDFSGEPKPTARRRR